MLQLLRIQVRLWTIIGLIVTLWEVVKTNEEDVERIWIDLKNLRQDVHFLFFYRFCTIRLYLLAYIILIYQVFVEMKNMLITPWLVISSLHVLEPNAIFRLYFWILIFKFWLDLIDKEIFESLHEAHKEKILQKSKLDIDEENQVRETRRRIKGIRFYIAMRNPQLDDTLPASRFCADPIGKSCCQHETTCSSNTDSEFKCLSESDEDFQEYNRYSWKILHQYGPARVTDCILQQITDLVQKLVSKSREELLKESRKAEEEYARQENSYLIRCPSSYKPLYDAVLNCPQYRKPRYLIEYPEIFAKKKVSKRSAKQRNITKFVRMLLKISRSEDTLR